MGKKLGNDSVRCQAFVLRLHYVIHLTEREVIYIKKKKRREKR